MGIAKPPPPLLQLISTATAANNSTNPHSLCTNPCARNFLSQNKAIVEKLNSKQLKAHSKQLETSKFYPDSFPVTRNFVIDRWNSELALSPR